MKIIAVIGFDGTPDNFLDYVEQDLGLYWSAKSIGIPHHYFIISNTGLDEEVTALFDLPPTTLDSFGVTLLREIPVNNVDSKPCVYCNASSTSYDPFGSPVCDDCKNITDDTLSDLGYEEE